MRWDWVAFWAAAGAGLCLALWWGVWAAMQFAHDIRWLLLP